jgi:DNA-binding NarL/FixJ family response regulator/EAL domain-containing protein (putative c-di-GMP-specific phosphodiesterase class I)
MSSDVPRRSIRVLIAADDPEVVAALTDLLGSDPRITVVAVAGDADAAARLAAAYQPDVALLDVPKPGDSARAVGEIRQVAPETRVVALSVGDDQTSVTAIRRAGALGYVDKGTPIDEILEALDRASRGLPSLLDAASTRGSVEVAKHLGHQEVQEARARTLATDIDAVLEPGAIRAVYQPVFELTTGRIVGYEGLARFDREPRRGPDVWMAAAGEAGRRDQLELAAIRAQLARFSELPAPAYLALNISPTTAMSEELATLLSSLPMDRLVLEITEHAPVADYEALQAGLADLRAQGVRLAVDDAGAGFASLRHILQLSPDIIKLDGSLTRGIDADRARRSLASALIAFAAQMGMAVVAEGIETAAELATLLDLGVAYGQGYILRRPGEPPGANAAVATGAVATLRPLDRTAGVRVAIVDNHPVVASAVAALLASEPGLEVVGVALDTARAVELLDHSQPDVVVCDTQLGDESGFGLLERYRSGRPAFVMYSSYDYPIYHRAAFEAGAAAFVLKMAQPAELVAAIMSAAAGQSSFSPSTMRAVHSVGEIPTVRELAVLERLAHGQSTAEIAAALGIRPRTVDGHLGSLFDRVGVGSRTELVLHAVREGWMRPKPTKSADPRTGRGHQQEWLVDAASLGASRRARRLPRWPSRATT